MLINNKVSDDGQWGIMWVVLLAGATMREVQVLWDDHNLDPDHTWCQHEGDCCGHTYHSAVRIARRTSTRTLVTQSWSVNI
jgi:hypothetical protein